MEKITCSVIGCGVSSETFPKKYLFLAPLDIATKGLWIYATGQNYSQSSEFFICENHFNISADVENWRNGKPNLKKFIHPTRKLYGNHPFMQGAQYRENTSQRNHLVNESMVEFDKENVVYVANGAARGNPADYVGFLPEWSDVEGIVEIVIPRKKD